MYWASEDTHPEIRNMKSQEDGQSEFYIARKETEKKKKKMKSKPKHPLPLGCKACQTELVFFLSQPGRSDTWKLEKY